MVPSPGGLANGLPSPLVFIWPQELPNVHMWGALSPSRKQGCGWAQGGGDAATLFMEAAGLGSVLAPWVFRERSPGFQVKEKLKNPGEALPVRAPTGQPPTAPPDCEPPRFSLWGLGLPQTAPGPGEPSPLGSALDGGAAPRRRACEL